MKRLGTILLASVMVVGLLAGCGTGSSTDTDGSEDVDSSNTEAESSNTDTDNSTSQNTLRVGISLNTNTETTWVERDQELQAYCEELGYSCISQCANDDSEKQITQIESMLVQGIDILIVALVDPASAANVIEDAKAEGVIIVGLDRFDNQCTYDVGITFDNYAVGELGAEYAVEKEPSGNYVWLGGDVASVAAAQDIEDGAVDVVNDYSDIDLVMKQNCKLWAASEALAHAEDALTANNNDIAAILCANDGIAGGAIQALESAGLEGQVIVTGQDCELSSLQRIAKGTQTMSLLKSAKDMSRSALDAAVTLYNGEELEGLTEYYGVPAILLAPVVIDKDNLDENFIDTGIYTEAEIYG